MRTKIIEIINEMRKTKNEPLKQFESNLDLRNDLNLNSFDLTELTVRLEDQFHLDIFSDRLVNTLGEIY